MYIPYLIAIGASLLIAVGISYSCVTYKSLPQIDPVHIAWARIIIALAAILFVLDAPISAVPFLTQNGLQPLFSESAGIFDVLFQTHIFQMFLSSELLLLFYKCLTIFSLLALMIGWCHRFTTPMASILYLGYLGIIHEYVLLSHQGLHVIWFLFLLLFLPHAERLAIQRYRRSTFTLDYHSSYLALLVLMTIPYFSAGLNKVVVMGTDWFAAANVRGNLHANSYIDFGSMQWDLSIYLAQLPDSLFIVAGAVTLLVQLMYPLVVISQNARIVLPALIISMHVAIWAGMGFLFYDLILLQCIAFIPLALHAAGSRPSKQVISHTPMRRHKLALLLVILLIPPSISLAADIVRFPFTNWGVYSNPSSLYSRGDIERTRLFLEFEDGRIEESSPHAFKESLDLFSYPRKSCYYLYSSYRNQEQCGRFFINAIARLNATHYQDDPIHAVHLLFWSWSVNDLLQENYLDEGFQRGSIRYEP